MIAEADLQYEHVYRDSLVLAMGFAMPNLEALNWEEQYAVDKSFFEALNRTSIQRLRLKGTPIDWATPLQLQVPASGWSRRTLYLDMKLSIGRDFDPKAEGGADLEGLIKSCLKPADLPWRGCIGSTGTPRRCAKLLRSTASLISPVCVV